MRRAREQLAKIFGQVIGARRASGAREDDILQCFIDARYDKARPETRRGCMWQLRWPPAPEWRLTRSDAWLVHITLRNWALSYRPLVHVVISEQAMRRGLACCCTNAGSPLSRCMAGAC